MQHHLDIRAKLIIMISVMASMFLVALDQTIIATALGKIVEDFNAFDSLSWIVTAYLLTTTVTVPIAGKLSDLFGRRLMLLIGVAIFGIASLMTGLSGDVTQLIIWRAVQGIGGGIITANAFTIIGDLFAARERGRWQGLIGAIFGISSVVGPLLGGWLTEGQNIFGSVTSWHWIFWINVPIAVLAFALIFRFCPPLKHAKKARVDYIGAAFLTLGLATLVLAVDNTEAIFGDVMSSLSLSLAGLRAIMAVIVVAAFVGFVWREKRAVEPILPLTFFKNWNYSTIMIIALLFGAGFMSSIIYLTQFNQQVFGAGPTESGLMLIPMVAGIMLSSIGSGQIISRTGRYKVFMQVGIVLATVMVALLATLNPETPYWHEAVMITFLGIGMGFVMPVMNVAVQNEFKQKELGVATSSIQLFRGLGSTVGIAIFGAMLTNGLAANIGDLSQNNYVRAISSNPEATRIGNFNDPNTLLTLNTQDIKQQITDGFNTQITQLPEQAQAKAKTDFKQSQDQYSSIITHAFSDSLRVVFIWSAIMMLAASAAVMIVRERELKDASIETTPGEL